MFIPLVLFLWSTLTNTVYIKNGADVGGDGGGRNELNSRCRELEAQGNEEVPRQWLVLSSH